MSSKIWHGAEEGYLKQLHDLCLKLSKKYMQLYGVMQSKQTKLRLPAIVMSSVSGAASFVSTTFPQRSQRFVSIGIGVINITIAVIQTYESYLKIGDIVSKSLAVSNALKKLADDIFCELFIPVIDREADGIVFLRDCFNRYQTIMEQAPPPVTEGMSNDSEVQSVKKKIHDAIRHHDIVVYQERAQATIGQSFRLSTQLYPEDQLLPQDHIFQEKQLSKLRNEFGNSSPDVIVDDQRNQDS